MNEYTFTNVFPFRKSHTDLYINWALTIKQFYEHIKTIQGYVDNCIYSIYWIYINMLTWRNALDIAICNFTKHKYHILFSNRCHKTNCYWPRLTLRLFWVSVSMIRSLFIHVILHSSTEMLLVMLAIHTTMY